MMATEATSENLADASTSTPELTTTSTSSQDVVPSETTRVNGESGSEDHRPYVEGLDSSLNSADVSTNGGSDTEGARAEHTKGDGLGHVRTASAIKKPTSFKAVSVNKTFLAAKGTSTPVTAKPGDKPVPTTPSTPTATLSTRPRLVAKLGSGLRDSSPKAASSTSGGNGFAPDASAVWNKNRPPPPPEQKRITDEELKQQYGIHLATRLQSDEPGRQANWADIDDDDDDWAPESIEWTDGTKISLPSTEEAALAQAQAQIQTNSTAVSAATDADVTGITKPISPVPVSLTPVVRLGGMSSTSGKGLILKGAPEKPTLVAKPPGPPTPVKSPWAALPPVEKVAPVAIETQQLQQSQPSRFTGRDPHGFDNTPPPAAKEIAADDFSRTWREGNSNTSRELFNSQSGRYEPVNDGRRNSGRYEGHPRQPALLQRPSHDQQSEPAGPSAAFQTHRATGQEASFARRRASSNLSGNSGNFVRRMSRGQDTIASGDMPYTRRGSQVAVSDDVSPRNLVPSAQQSLSHTSPILSHPSPASIQGQLAQTVPSAVSLEDDVEYQKKLMRERREQAIKRRLEQEAKDEAEKKERIRLKLEAMGPAPESKKARKETPKDEGASPSQTQAKDISSLASPPKPPVPEVAGEVKQYGMMKVHHAEPISSSNAVQESDESTNVQDSRANGLHSSGPKDNQPHAQPSWQGNSTTPERHSMWAASTTNSTQGRNVWGPPTSDKTLGNGTFNPELSRLPDLHSAQQITTSNPGPIGPPGPNSRINGGYQVRGRDQFVQRPAPIGPPMRSPQDLQKNQAVAAWAKSAEDSPHKDANTQEQYQREASRRELPNSGAIEHTGAGTVYKDTWKKVSLAEDGSRTSVQAVLEKIDDGKPISASAAWNSLPAQLEQAENARNNQLGPNGASIAREQWRQVPIHDGSDRIDTIASSTLNNRNLSSNSSPQVRGTSRFFPANRDVRLEESGYSFEPARPGSPSPPPPTMAGHPAYDGDILHPQVSLPRPIIVRLPPSQAAPPPLVLAPIGPPRPRSFAAAAATPLPQLQPLPPPRPVGPQDPNMKFRNTEEWQDRINNLFGRKPSPPKAHSLAVDSASKSVLEQQAAYSSATVSLPSLVDLPQSEGDLAYETKLMAEECFEEQEMGSLPSIRFPTKAPEAAWHLAGPPKPLHKKFHVHDAISVDEIRSHPQSSMNINLPGMSKNVVVAIKNERQKSNPRKTRGGSSRHTSSTHTRGGRSRDAPSGFAPSIVDHPAAVQSSNRGRGRGSFGSTWNQRHSSSTNTAVNV